VILRLPWKPGGAAEWRGRAFVSVTEFRTFRLRDLPRSWRDGIKLRRSWGQMPGAVGLWLWSDPLHRRGGSVSIWRDEEDLRAFVRWEPHVAIMRRSREKGRLISCTYSRETLHRDQVWREARRLLASVGLRRC